MSKQYPGGFIIANPTAPTSSAAPGVWTLDQAQQYIKAGTWPGLPDPYFPYVTMLLPGNGTNGSQNNTFLDSSINNFTITRNGGTTQGTFTPYGANWSNYFDGTGDFLSVANNVALQMGSGAFTLEAWVFRGALSVAHTIFAKGGASTGFVLGITSTNVLRFTDTTTNISSTGTIPVNTWTHVAVVREGTGANQLKLYINGVNDGTGTSATNFTQTEQLQIGRDRSGASDFNGYISNARILKGTALYTSSFTPPNAPLTAIANTSLLTCQSNRFIDNSANNFTITRNGNTSIQRSSPFSPTAAYSAIDFGGSGYFDGSGDYLTIANSSAIQFGTAAFTIQAWIYRSVSGATHTIAAKGGASTGWVLQVTSTNVLRFTDTTTNIDTTTTIPDSTWVHVAVVRTGTGSNELKLYINAVDSATGTSSTNFNQTEVLNIGADRSNANSFNGYIANLKYTVGTAETIVVPTTPMVGGTVLLNFTNASIIDNAMMNDLVTVGTAQISTAQSKWGGGSLSVGTPGSGAFQTADLAGTIGNFGTGDFTVEAWVYFTNTSQGGVISKSNSPTDGWFLQVSTTTAQFGVYVGSVSGISGSWSGVVSTWYHFAATRSSGTLRLFVNGNQIASTSFPGNIGTNTQKNIYVGINGTSTSNTPLNGFIDDLRITNGYARYTAGFTPPTGPFLLK